MSAWREPARSACALLLVLGGAVAPTWAAGKVNQTQAQVEYRQERARCLRGESHQARETCLKEAGAAYDEARRGRLGRAEDAELARNATKRCDAQPMADRDACIQRILGSGNTQGSVGGGGLIRQTETKSK